MADPNWSNVVTYLRFNAAGSSTVIDEVGGSRVWTLAGGAAQSATGAIKGSGSLRTVGNTGDMYVISTDNLSDWAFGTGDFTLDYTVQCGEQGPDFFTTLMEGVGSWFFRLRWFGRQVEFMGREFDPGPGYLTDGLPHAIRLSRVSGVLYCQIDGRTDILDVASTLFEDDLPAPIAKIIGRADDATQGFDGVSDEARVTKGVGRSTGPYTPVAGEFETGGAAGITAALSARDRADVVTAAAAVSVSITLVRRDASDTLAASASVRVATSLSVTDRPDRAAAAAAAVASVGAAISDGADRLVAGSSLSIVGALASTDAPDLVAASASVGAAPSGVTLLAIDSADLISALSSTAVAVVMARTDAGDVLASIGATSIAAAAYVADVSDVLGSSATLAAGALAATLNAADAADRLTAAASARATAALAAPDASDLVASTALARLLAALWAFDDADVVQAAASEFVPFAFEFSDRVLQLAAEDRFVDLAREDRFVDLAHEDRFVDL